MDQQFRLKWNNHCNTLLQVFGNLLKTETLVDCTIGADGQYLKAHKVVVSACSPYFQSLFTEHFDKHPIIILKDIKFGELQSMIDYMYEGEVNISQDQLPSFLKAAASIQLKGLTQNVKPDAGAAPHESKPVPQLNSAAPSRGMLSNGSLTPSSMLNVELEEGQQRKKRKMMNESQRPPSSASSSPSLVPDLVVPNVILDVPGENSPGQAGGGSGPQNGSSSVGDSSLKKEPSEYSGRSEDEEEDGMSHDGWDLSNDALHDSNSGLSAGDGRQLHHGGPPGANRAPGGGPNPAMSGPDMSNVDENNQELHNAIAWDMFSGYSILDTDMKPSIAATGGLTSPYPFRNIQRFDDAYKCHKCKKSYKTRKTLQVHARFQCGKTPQFKCPLCPKTAFQKVHIEMHVWGTHKMIGWKYWNKNQPTDESNRPHAMPLSALTDKMVDSGEPSLSGVGKSGVETQRIVTEPNTDEAQFVKPKCPVSLSLKNQLKTEGQDPKCAVSLNSKDQMTGEKLLVKDEPGVPRLKEIESTNFATSLAKTYSKKVTKVVRNDKSVIGAKAEDIANRSSPKIVQIASAKGKVEADVADKIEIQTAEDECMKVKTEPGAESVGEFVALKEDSKKSVARKGDIVKDVIVKEDIILKDVAVKECVRLKGDGIVKDVRLKESVRLKEDVIVKDIVKRAGIVKDVNVKDLVKKDGTLKEDIVKESVVLKEGRKSGRLAAKVKVEAWKDEVKGKRSEAAS